MCGSIWNTVACRVAHYIQDTTKQSFAFSFPVEFLDFSKTFTHSLSTCLLACRVCYSSKVPSKKYVAWCCLRNIILTSAALPQQIHLQHSVGIKLTEILVKEVFYCYIFIILLRDLYLTNIVLTLYLSHTNSTSRIVLKKIFRTQNILV